MIIPEKIEKQEEIQKVEILGFYARKRVIGIATILNELSPNYLSGNSVWSYYTREQTMIYSNSRETREADMEEILIKDIKDNGKLLQNYWAQISEHQCSKCYGEDNVIPNLSESE
ncbi:hypothetical protein H5410_061115 [Solanum commersonii]|uniref:Uncharacterized protein n=1 Tax=Solanum commersonii TaxID=4109 RepID=A0A9J5W6V9_SOLCO|nr:hypothetical protein H5410_061115 [Solanum commersonii]